MRKPTNLFKAYEPWRRRLKGEQVPAHPDSPEPGFYKTKEFRGGPFVPVAIWIEQKIGKDGQLLEAEVFRCLVNGKPKDAAQVWNFAVKNPIEEEEYHRAMKAPKKTPAAEPISPKNLVTHRPNLSKIEPLF